MAMKAVAIKLKAGAAPSTGFRALLFSTSRFPFNRPTPPQNSPPAEPSTNLYVFGLSDRTTTQRLWRAFGKFGNVVDAEVIFDRVTGFSKCFGFVRYATLEEAEAGIKGMEGQFLDGRVIFAEYAGPRNPSPPPQNGPSNCFTSSNF